jgi:hypothetical protein
MILIKVGRGMARYNLAGSFTKTSIYNFHIFRSIETIILIWFFELQQRVHIKMDKIPYRRCEALPQGRTFPAVCSMEFQKTNLI